jgi:hypothetical protein
MTKPLFKIGMLVRINNPEGQDTFGAIDAVVQTAKGNEYRVIGQDDFIGEDLILTSYREWKPRARKGTTVSSTKRTRSTKREQAAA